MAHSTSICSAHDDNYVGRDIWESDECQHIWAGHGILLMAWAGWLRPLGLSKQSNSHLPAAPGITHWNRWCTKQSSLVITSCLKIYNSNSFLWPQFFKEPKFRLHRGALEAQSILDVAWIFQSNICEYCIIFGRRNADMLFCFQFNMCQLHSSCLWLQYR